jgi:GTPase Era involved in 16S rRNA processing
VKNLVDNKEIHTQLNCYRKFFEDDNIIRIRSLIMVERETQKGVIGHKVPP